MREIAGWLLKGAAMGAANVIPGVSGGTIAFITGIYERLISALKNIDLLAIRLFFTGRFIEFGKKIDFRFLFFLFLGVGVSILSLAKALELAFTHYESLTLAFFFGLIVASVIGVGRQIDSLDVGTIISFIVGTAIAVGIAFLPPAQANTDMFYILLCGVVAVCSMILPGLSGSYILLLMGNYILVLQAISSLNLKILIPLGVGCVVGLLVFSRLLNYLFAHFRNQTIALLTGFVAGSLLIIWPWKTTEYLEIGDKMKAVGYSWQLPELSGSFFIALALSLIGFVMVYYMDKRSRPTD